VAAAGEAGADVWWLAPVLVAATLAVSVLGSRRDPP
jgi:hypothetical protein